MSHKPKTPAEKATRSVLETIIFTADEAKSWNIPEIQRGARPNAAKVQKLAAAIAADGGILPGILTFGVLDKTKYLIDGLQRREAFLMSGKPEGFADTRVCYFDTMGEMADEFVELNEHLVPMRPDDRLRAKEWSVPAIRRIREECPFVGYDFIRRGENSPLLSMSVVLRTWEVGRRDVPGSVSINTLAIAETLQEDDAKWTVRFLNCCYKAWGRDVEYQRLWLNLNLGLCAWLYRRTVMTAHSTKSVRLDDGLFTKAMMALSSSSTYLDYLVGRQIGDRDRAPAYNRITALCADRVQKECGKRVMFPRPAWAHGHRGRA